MTERRETAEVCLTCERVGSVLLVRAAGSADEVNGIGAARDSGGADAATRAFAAQLVEEPDHTIVVADVDPGYPPQAWESVADELASAPGTLRIVPSRRTRVSTTAIGAWLAERLEREVIAHEGRAATVAAGALFVPPTAGRGWLRFQPGQDAAVPFSRRFPTPAWEGPAFAEAQALSDDLIVEPLPAGVWIHAAEESARSGVYRKWLMSGLPGAPKQPRAVVSHPGASPVPIRPLAAYWHRLPAEVQPSIRFDEFGPVQTSAGDAFGQALADILESPVVVGVGVRLAVSSAAGEDIRTLLPLGAMSWTPFVADVGFRPSAACGGYPAGPQVVAGRPPMTGLVEIGAGVYEYAADAVLEVIQSGLWIRPATPPAGSASVRGLPPDAGRAKLHFASGMRDLASDVELRLAPEDKAWVEIVPSELAVSPTVSSPARPRVRLESGPQGDLAASAPAVSQASAAAAVVTESIEPVVPAPEPVTTPPPEPTPPVPDPPAPEPVTPESAEIWTDVVVAPAPRTRRAAPSSSARVQPIPKPEAAAVPPPHGIQQERTWLRHTLSRQYDATVNVVSRILSEMPGLRGHGTSTPAELLSDLVAVRLYLTGDTRGLDDAVRTAEVGPHVPLARCVAAGLRHLPSHRGAVRTRTELTGAQLQWYRDRAIVTEWSFLPAVIGTRHELPGDTDVLLWSMTARRTGLIDPHADGQVLFLPGTSFRVLGVHDGIRPRLLLREISASEVGPDGRLVGDPGARDEFALAHLESDSRLWDDEDAGELPDALADRFSSPPGLLGAPRGGGSQRSTLTPRTTDDEDDPR